MADANEANAVIDDLRPPAFHRRAHGVAQGGHALLRVADSELRGCLRNGIQPAFIRRHGRPHALVGMLDRLAVVAGENVSHGQCRISDPERAPIVALASRFEQRPDPFSCLPDEPTEGVIHDDVPVGVVQRGVVAH